jgi:capsular exopolysaccharide synthesis family protein
MASNNDNFPGSDNTSNNGSYRGEYQGPNTPGNSSDRDPDEIDLKRLFFTLWNHKWIIVVTVAAFTILAGVIAFTTTPIYQSEASLLISQQQNRYSYAGSDLANLLTSTYGIGTGSTISNELQVLRSRKLSLEMADSLMKRRLMDNGNQYPALYKSYPTDSSLAARDTVALRIRNNISFSQVDREADMVSITYESPAPREAADIVNLSIEVYTNLSTRQNRRSANSAVDFLESERQRIEKRLNNVEDRLRTFMNEKQLVQVDAQTEELITRMAELESRRQEAKVKLVAVESGISQYEDRLNNIKPGLAEQYSDAVGPNMMRLQYQLAELEIEKVQLIANNPGIQENPNPPSELEKINDKIDVYKNRIKELTTDLVEQGDQYLGFLGGSDGNISQAVTELNKRLIELKVERQQYSAQMDVINEQLSEQRTFFDNLPDNMIELARLKRDVKINEELYLTVSQQFAEMSLWKQTQFGLGRPLDEGYIPEAPVKPNTKLYLLVGFILGGILSVGYIFVRQAFNTRIDGIEKLKEFGYPLLAVIPDMSDFIQKEFDGEKSTTVKGMQIATTTVSILDSVSPISESFRRLQSNIIYSNPDHEMNSLMITSGTKGEGKTTTVSNLGSVFAEAGYNTVIVDTDLRRPNLLKQFGSRKAPGIVEVLFDGVSLDEALQPTPLSKLSILPAGNRPPNPSSIVQSRSFLKTIKDLEKRFDMVLIDTPPYGIITDASALIQQTDGVVVVARFNETAEAELSHLFNNLQRVEANVVGTVLTAFEYEKSSDYYYNSYYYREIYRDYASYHSEE